MRDHIDPLDPKDPYAPDTAELREISAFLRSDAATGKPADAAASWAMVWARVGKGQASEHRGIERVSREGKWFLAKRLDLGAPPLRRGAQTLPWKAASALPVVVAASLGIIAVIAWDKQSHRASDAPPPRTYVTTAGQQATVTLADGSQAILGPATTLSVITSPTDASVDVRVTGQALFTVVPKHDRPFRVHAGNAVTRVLGTRFLVRQYTADHVTRVVVIDGRVSLSGLHRTLIGTNHVLTHGTLGTVDDSGRVEVTPNIAIEDYTAWTKGRLVFHKTPARDAVIELGRAYGADIRIADSVLAAQPLTWTIPFAEQSLSDVLESLVDVLDAHPVRNGRIIFLVPGRSASARPSGPRLTTPSERQYGR